MIDVYWGTFLFGGILILSSIVMGGGDGDADMDKDLSLDKDISFDKDVFDKDRMLTILMVMAQILILWDGSHF